MCVCVRARARAKWATKFLTIMHIRMSSPNIHPEMPASNAGFSRLP